MSLTDIEMQATLNDRQGRERHTSSGSRSEPGRVELQEGNPEYSFSQKGGRLLSDERTNETEFTNFTTYSLLWLLLIKKSLEKNEYRESKNLQAVASHISGVSKKIFVKRYSRHSILDYFFDIYI